MTFLFKSHECTFMFMSYLVHLFSKVIRCLVTQLCLTLCDPMNCSPPGFSVHGISQANILEWIAISFSRGCSPPRNQTLFSCIAGRFFTREAACNSPVWCKKNCYILGDLKWNPFISSYFCKSEVWTHWGQVLYLRYRKAEINVWAYYFLELGLLI